MSTIVARDACLLEHKYLGYQLNYTVKFNFYYFHFHCNYIKKFETILQIPKFVPK